MVNYEILRNIEIFTKRLNDLKVAIDIEGLVRQIKKDEELIADPSFYEDLTNSQKVLKDIKKHKGVYDTFISIENLLEDLNCYYEMQKSGEVTEEEIDTDICNIIKDLDKNLKSFEEKMLLNGEYDDCDALFELHPGEGGTEAMDWAEMLFRMYKRYAEKHDYEFEVLDYLDGEEAGIKSVSFVIKGENAYGYLKSEHGVHRLVRISPFDSGARRHTSFCGCNVSPVINDVINIDIKPEDIRVDTYRSSGAGGQYINKTESAIRITHLKTGLVVTCQNQRSQIQNREKAMQILKSKLYQIEKAENDKKLKNINGANTVNGFGGQIRSYVFHPYSLVKDARTGYETANANGVLDGELDGLVDAYLHYNKTQE